MGLLSGQLNGTGGCLRAENPTAVQWVKAHFHPSPRGDWTFLGDLPERQEVILSTLLILSKKFFLVSAEFHSQRRRTK